MIPARISAPIRVKVRLRCNIEPALRPISVLLLALITSILIVVTPAADADAGATSGRFIPLSARLLDTRQPLSSVNQYATPMPANTWRQLQVAGRSGVPAQGVVAVAVTLTAINPGTTGLLDAAPGGESVTTALSYLNYNAGDTTSNSAVIGVGADGTVQLRSNRELALIVDVQGYYTAGDVTAGGFSLTTPTRVADTRSNQGMVGALQGGTAKSLSSFGGLLPSSATAVVLNISVVGASAAGNIKVAAVGRNFGSAAYAYEAGNVTTIGLTTELGSNSTGIKVLISTGQANLTVDVIGYFTPTADGYSFRAARSRLLDTRAGGVSVQAHETVEFSFVGSPEISTQAVALEAHMAVLAGSTSGYVNVWAADLLIEPQTAVASYDASSTTSSAFTTGLSSSLAVKVTNHGSQPVHLIIDLQGYYGIADGNNSCALNEPVIALADESDPVVGSSDDGPGRASSDTSAPDDTLADAADSQTAPGPCATSDEQERTQAGVRRICFMGLGSCGWEVPRVTGSVVHIPQSVLDAKKAKHALSNVLITRAIYYGYERYYQHDFPTDVTYEFTVWEYNCYEFSCARTNKWVNVRFIVDWFDDEPMHGILRSMYCHEFNKCPLWSRKAGLYLGPPGPRMTGLPPLAYTS